MAKKLTRQEFINALKALYLNNYSGIGSALIVCKDGHIRWLNFRFGVEKFLKGGKLPYDPLSRDLLPVCDLQKIEDYNRGLEKSPYATINLQTAKEVKLEGDHWIVEE